MTNRWQAIFLLFTITLAVPGIVRAEDEPQRLDNKAVSNLLARAQIAANNNKMAEAIGLWMQAWAILPLWHLPCYIGQGHFLLNQPDKAATYLTRCLKLAPYPTTAEGVEHRRREREMLEIALDHVAVVVITASQGARVSVDREEKGTAPLAEEVFLMPGDHRFIAELNDRTVSRTLATKRREKHTIDFVFPQEKAEPPPTKPLETKPSQAKPIEPKPSQIPRTLPIASNSTPLPWIKQWVPSIALLGTSAALASAGFVMHAKAEQHDITLQDITAARRVAAAAGKHEECAALRVPFEQARTDYLRMSYGSLFSFGAAGVLGVVGLAYPWLPIHGKTTSIAVSNSGLTVHGNF